MSNPVNLEATVFTNPVTGEVTKGFRIYDEYDKGYNNVMETIPEDDLELLQEAANDDDDTITGILDFVREHEMGININGEYYEWSQIKSILGSK